MFCTVNNGYKFRSIEVTLGIGCRLRCKFCPQDKLINNYNKNGGEKIMTFETFKNALSMVMEGGGVTFSGMVEPFHNPQCAEMILYAYDKGYKISLFTTLVGMKEKDLEIIKDIEFDHVTLHIPDEKYNSKFVINDEYIDILKKFKKYIDINSYSCHGEVNTKIKKYFNNEIIHNEMMNRAGNLEYEYLKKYEPKGQIICQIGTSIESGSWAPEILPDGTVVLCCMDYSMKHVLGNVNKQNVKEIYESEEYQKILKGLNDDKIDILCRHCSAACEDEKLQSMKLREMLHNNNDSIVKRINSAKNICILGLGKLFVDKYFPLKWDLAINANIFSDNDVSKKEKFPTLNFVLPEDLVKYDDLLVITHTKDATSFNNQLEAMGVFNYINIYDIYNYVTK